MIRILENLDIFYLATDIFPYEEFDQSNKTCYFAVTYLTDGQNQGKINPHEKNIKKPAPFAGVNPSPDQRMIL
jgi:hypothetical protein